MRYSTCVVICHSSDARLKTGGCPMEAQTVLSETLFRLRVSAVRGSDGCDCTGEDLRRREADQGVRILRSVCYRERDRKY